MAVDQFVNDGYVVLPALLSGDELAAAVRHADSLLSEAGWSDNDFDGPHARRQDPV